MKYLVFGLGNIGEEYKNTRHNVGFVALDSLAAEQEILFTKERHSYVADYKYKGRTLMLIKPTTYMNLSGKAVLYWLSREKVPVENILIIVDDLALPFGTIRIRAKGSDGGHNGLININETLNNNNYARLRFGIGNEFLKGKQVDYVLGQWTEEEKALLPSRIDKVKEAAKSFVTIGLERTMNFYNGK